MTENRPIEQKWCEHIQWHRDGFPNPGWFLWISAVGDGTLVHETCKTCPVCGTERPNSQPSSPTGKPLRPEVVEAIEYIQKGPGTTLRSHMDYYKYADLIVSELQRLAAGEDREKVLPEEIANAIEDCEDTTDQASSVLVVPRSSLQTLTTFCRQSQRELKSLANVLAEHKASIDELLKACEKGVSTEHKEVIKRARSLLAAHRPQEGK